MNKQLQTHTWTILPKEFKEYIIKVYKSALECSKVDARFLENIFGKHNLTCDAEGEIELLHATRQKVMGLYANAKKLYDLYTNATCINDAEGRTIDRTSGAMSVLENLFGSKCVPDDVDSLQQKPAKPKFKVGESVEVLSEDYLGEHGIITAIDDTGYIRIGGIYGVWFAPKNLKPYTETTEETSPNLNHSDINIDDLISKGYIPNPAKGFDSILKDNFRNERRLNIAAMVMQGILSNESRMKRYENMSSVEPYEKLTNIVARNALRYANAIIAECEIFSQPLCKERRPQ